MKNYGINDQFITELEEITNEAASYNKEIDKLRAETKSKTVRTHYLLQKIKPQNKKVKKVIKQNLGQDKWNKFGINDKR